MQNLFDNQQLPHHGRLCRQTAAVMRVHRSYIIAPDKIESIGGTLIHVSDAYKPAFEQYLSQRMLR